ncbi:MAG: GNAT family protein [Dehalococcoidia bacterium]
MHERSACIRNNRPGHGLVLFPSPPHAHLVPPAWRLTRTTAASIGSCSLSGQTPEDRVAELGVLIGDRASWGQGLGFDALRTLLYFGFREMNLRRIWLRVDENHPRGIPLYERLGFTHDGRLRGAHWSRGRALDFLVMGIQRAEFDQRYGAFEEVGDVPRG